ncbi:hypothetical protein H0X32_01250 [Patescibacteria group bacterium]|nr:hypothetical protein [Patescibacteria group bacterium]
MERVLPLLRKYLFLIVLIVVILGVTAAYLEGYRVGPGIRLSRVGTLTLNLPAGATVYADQILRNSTTKAGAIDIELISGSHSIIVSIPGDYPWSDLVAVTSGKNIQLSPILVPNKPDATVLTDSARTDALNAIASTTIPSKTNPLRLEGGCAAVYVSNNQIITDAVTASGCTPPVYLCIDGSCASTIIYSPTIKLSAVLPYPGRQDALLVGLGNTLYAIALDPRSPQFFAPVLGATNPIFGVLSNGTLVVHNDASVFSIKL